jgi:Domain of unknown function (DUF4326)
VSGKENDHVQRLERAESRQALERDAVLHRPPELMNALDELRGRDLVCWCAPLACHGDVLIELANRR